MDSGSAASERDPVSTINTRTGLTHRPAGRAAAAAAAGGVGGPAEAIEGLAQQQQLQQQQNEDKDQHMVWLNKLTKGAGHVGILVPSTHAFHALLLLPLLLWLAAVASGMVLFEGLPARKADVQHLMLWFDVAVFRTLAGPALPFILLLMRCTAMFKQTPNQLAAKQASSRASAQQQQHQQQQGSAARGTLLLRCAALYTAVTLTRMLAYAAHLVFQYGLAMRPARAVSLHGSGFDLTSNSSTNSSLSSSSSSRRPSSSMLVNVSEVAGLVAEAAAAAVQADGFVAGIPAEAVVGLVEPAARVAADMAGLAPATRPLAFMSDHLLLGAAVVACLQVEIVCCVSDLIKLEAMGSHFIRQLAVAACCMLAATLSLFVCVDMHFTARLFHKPSESAAAVAAGLLLFQVPLVLWLRRQWRRTSLAADHA